MFQSRKPQTMPQKTLAFLELLYHSIVRQVRQSGGNHALLGLLSNMMQTVMFVMVFFLMFSIMGRPVLVRGDFVMFIMSGIFLFMTHIKAVGSVASAEGPTSAMMQHAPMNTILSILASAFAALYIQLLSMLLVLAGYHVIVKPIEVEYPLAALSMFVLAWATGCAVGLVFLTVKPWAPGVFGIVQTVYTRANMIASGKMFLANTLPNFMLTMFIWNPLFHCIDQSRGFTFVNYTAHKTNYMYPIYLTLILVMLGLMMEFFTRKHASSSWAARSF